MISRKEYLKGRDKDYPLDSELEENLEKLLSALNTLRAIYGKPMVVSSGYRPGHYNSFKGAKASSHLICKACDFFDYDGNLDSFCMENLDILEDLGLWLEHPDATPGWCHLDMRKRKNRVFRP